MSYKRYEKTAKARLKPYEDRITYIKEESVVAADEVPTNLDFVYIDGGHDMNIVLADCMGYYPKVKEGGYLAGHDFCLNFKGVIHGVIQFVAENNLFLEGSDIEWWIKKQ
jgi:hypothetical protein